MGRGLEQQPAKRLWLKCQPRRLSRGQASCNRLSPAVEHPYREGGRSEMFLKPENRTNIFVYLNDGSKFP